MQRTLGQASKQVGVSKPTLSKAISTGKLSATRREDGSWAIDPAELCRYVEANGHRFHSATGNGSRLETPPDTAATTAATDAQVEALRQVEVLLRQELTDVRIDRDRWCAEASAWRDQAQAVTRQHGPARARAATLVEAARGLSRCARYGPPDRSAAHRRPLSRGSNPCGYPHKPLVSYRINRQLSGSNSSSTDDSRLRGALPGPDSCGAAKAVWLFARPSPAHQQWSKHHEVRRRH